MKEEVVTVWSPGPEQPWLKDKHEPTEIEIAAYEVKYWTWAVAHEKAYREE